MTSLLKHLISKAAEWAAVPLAYSITFNLGRHYSAQRGPADGDESALSKPDYNVLAADNAQQALLINRAALQVSENALIINKRQLFSTTITSVSLILVSIVLCVFTGQLSSETDALKTSSINQVRAYFDIASVSASIEDNGNVITNYVYKNSGQTPAHNIFFQIVSILSTLDKSGSYNTYGSYSTICKPEAQTRFEQVGPGDTRNIVTRGVNLPDDRTGSNPFSKLTYSDSIPQDQLVKFKLSLETYVVTGLICYKDVFNIQRYARFCRSYDFKNLSVGKDALFGLCNDNDSN